METASSSGGYAVATDMSDYTEGMAVSFCLTDATGTPLTMAGTHPWQITDASGTPVFTPAAGTLDENASSTTFFADMWDGSTTDASSSPVAAGGYRVVFPGLAGSPFASFTIAAAGGTGTTTATSTGSGTGTTTPPSDLDNLVAQLQSLANTYPSFAGVLQGLINELLGPGSTTTGSGSPQEAAMIDQNGGTFSAGGSIDFGGHNFGHEEQVSVMLDGQQVASAHADGGGNFSTGSLSLPTTPGTYTYTFTGAAAGDSASATITVE
ncbi:hypothetical protein KGO04_01555 [Patescibacteria group bacterium]|nr:hypothetical protein [Patescibacteria group bacterium]MDE1945260.1 hypothetical protein [Patescibacteria group bacterium]